MAALVTTTGRELPLRLCGKAKVNASHEDKFEDKFLAVIPTNVTHRQFRTFYRHLVVAHYSIPHLLGHLVAADEERADGNLMFWILFSKC